MPSPIQTYRDATDDRGYISGPFRPFNGQEYAWLMFDWKRSGVHEQVMGSDHWSSNFGVRRVVSISPKTYRFEFQTQSSGSCYVDMTLQDNQVYHIVLTFSSGVINGYANGLLQPSKVNATAGGVLNGLTAEVLFLVGQMNTAATVASPSVFERMAVGYGPTAASIPLLPEIIQLRDRLISPTAATGVKHVWSLTGTDGVDVASSDAGLQDQVGSYHFNAVSTPKPVWSGPQLLFTPDKLLECRSDSFGRNLFFICTQASDGQPLSITAWDQTPRDVLTGAQVPVRVKKNGGAEITPEFIFWDQGGSFVFGRLPAGDAFDADDVITWTAPAAWLNTTSGPVYETVDGPVANRFGQPIFDPLPVEDRKLRVGQNASFMGYISSSGFFLSNLFHSAYALRNPATNLPFMGTTQPCNDITLPTSGWTCSVGGTTQWNGELGQTVIPYRMVPEGNYVLRWDGAGDVGFGAETNCTLATVSSNITGTVDNERVYNLTRTVTTELLFDMKWICAGNGVVTNVRIYPPDVDPDDPPFWHPSVLAKFEGCKYIRFMDTFLTNGNEIGSVAEWIPLDHPCYSTDRYYGWVVLSVVEPVPDINTATSNYFIEDKNSVFMKYTTATPHGYKTGQMITIENDPTKGMTFDTGEKVLYGTYGSRQMYVLNSTQFIVNYYAGTASLDGVTSPNWVSQDPLTANTHSWVQLSGMMPYELAVDLCNTVGADLWFNAPIHMDQASYETIATYIAANLDPGLKCYCEPGNEPWNTAVLFLHNDFYKSRHRELGRPGTWYAYIGEHNSMIHDWMEPKFVAVGRSGDYKRVYQGFPGADVVALDALQWCIDHGKRADVVTPASYWNPAWTNLPASYKVTPGEINDMNQVSCRYGGSPETFQQLVRRHRLGCEALFPDIEVIHYEGGYAAACYAKADNPSRVDLGFAAWRYPNSYYVTQVFLEELNEAGSAGHIHYVSVYADNVFGGGVIANGESFIVNYGAIWGMYTAFEQKPGKGDGSATGSGLAPGSPTTDNAPILDGWIDVNGDVQSYKPDYVLMDHPSGQAYLDWNSSLSGETPEPPDGGGGGVATWKPVLTLLNGGFEQVVMPDAGYTFDDPECPPWHWTPTKFLNADENAAPVAGTPPAPEGKQYLLLANDGVVTQSFYLAAGTYKVSAQFNQNTNAWHNDQDVSIKMDGVEVGRSFTHDLVWHAYETPEFTVAAAGTHTLSFTGMVLDAQALIDDVRMAVLDEEPLWTPVVLLSQGGFEVPDLSGGLTTADPSTSAWDWGADVLLCNLSSTTASAGNPISPGTGAGYQKSNVAYIGNVGSITQSVTFPADGTYGVSFLMAQKTGSQVFDLKIDGTVVSPGLTMAGVDYVLIQSATFPVTAGVHTIELAGKTAGAVAFIDDVRTYTVTGGTAGTPAVTPATATLNQGQTQTYTAADFAGAVTWSVVTGSGGSVTTGGVYTAPNHNGSTNFNVTIQATDGTDTDTAQAVVRPVVVTINETSPTVEVGSTVTLTGSVTGHVNAGKVWSVTSGSGSINASSGVFTPGGTAGTSVVRLTSAGNGAKFAEVTVTVTAGPGWIIVPALLVGGFEAPVLASGSYEFSLAGTWTSVGTYGGISRNALFDSGNQPPPEGNQVGFVQNQGSLLQTMTLAVGIYKLTGMFVQRAALGGQSLQLKVNGTVVHTFVAPSGSVWTLLESAPFLIGTAGSYAIEFVGTTTGGGTMLIDDVKLYVDSGEVTVPTVTPASVTLDQTQSTTFVAHDFAGAVLWNVVTASGGTINSSTGFYTSPTHTGSSNLDVTVQATDGTNTVTAHALVRPVVVTINQTSPTVEVNQSITLTGTITGHVNTTGTWSKVSGVGSINASTGVFAAGAVAGSAVVRLTSVGNPAKLAEVAVTVTAVAIPPSVTPNPISVQVNATQQFTANNFVGGTTGWSTTVGTVTSLGLFTAQNTPGAGIVTAFNGSQSANASVTVQATPPAVVTPTSATVIAGGQQQFASANFGGAVTWGTTAPSVITSGGLFTAEYHSSTLPLSRTVTGTSGAQTANATVTIPPIGISITPANPDVLPSGTVNLTATVTNAVNTAGTWSKVSGPGSINASTGVFTASATEGPTVVRFSLTANVAVFKETTVTTTAAPGAKTEWYGLLPRALTTVSEARPAGQMTIKFTSPNVFDGPTALPDRKIIVSITRGSTDARVCNLLISSRSGGTFTIEEVTGGPDSNCQVGDWASLRWTNEHVLQMQEAINALEP